LRSSAIAVRPKAAAGQAKRSGIGCQQQVSQGLQCIIVVEGEANARGDSRGILVWSIDCFKKRSFVCPG
jgi:hypothetical protein